MVRALKLVPLNWVRGTRRNSKLLLCEAPNRYGIKKEPDNMSNVKSINVSVMITIFKTEAFFLDIRVQQMLYSRCRLDLEIRGSS